MDQPSWRPDSIAIGRGRRSVAYGDHSHATGGGCDDHITAAANAHVFRLTA
jgi:hypothetical protein